MHFNVSLKHMLKYMHMFLVACTGLNMSLCWSVHWSVRRSVQNHFTFLGVQLLPLPNYIAPAHPQVVTSTQALSVCEYVGLSISWSPRYFSRLGKNTILFPKWPKKLVTNCRTKALVKPYKNLQQKLMNKI